MINIQIQWFPTWSSGPLKGTPEITTWVSVFLNNLRNITAAECFRVWTQSSPQPVLQKTWGPTTFSSHLWWVITDDRILISFDIYSIKLEKKFNGGTRYCVDTKTQQNNSKTKYLD